MFPTQNTVKVGDSISLTVGYPGGSSSRAAYAVHDAAELPQGMQDYVERVAAPYFAAYTRWLEEIHVGMTGGEMFDKVEEILPRATYGWSLCPGALPNCCLRATMATTMRRSGIYIGRETKPPANSRKRTRL